MDDNEWYQALTDKIATAVMDELLRLNENTEPGYDETYFSFHDEDLVSECFYGETHKALGSSDENGRKIPDMPGTKVWRRIVGQCSDPESCYDNAYRRGSFEDFAEACLMTDAFKKFDARARAKFIIVENPEFWDRAG